MIDKQQTAVEWLHKNLMYLDMDWELGIFTIETYWDKRNTILDQAKKMEKEQMFEYIKSMYVNGEESLKFHKEEFEKYYNETYRQQENP